MNSDIRVRSRFSVLASIIAGVAILSLVLSLFASLVVPFTVSAASPILSQSFGTGSTNTSVAPWSEGGDGAELRAASFGNDSVSPDGGRFAVAFGKDGYVCTTVTTTGYNNVKLSYYWRGDSDSGDSSDDGLVEIKSASGHSCTDSSGWTQLQNHDLRQDSSWTIQSAFTNAGMNNTSFLLRFRTNTNHTDEHFRIDGVQVVGDAINTAPVASNGTVTTNEDTAVSANLAATDSDVPSQTLTYSVVATPAHGTVTGLPNTTGAFTYTPAANYNGTDSFTFKANDGTANSNTATVSITVTPVNDLPVITLTGASTVNVNLGSAYTELGALASDVEDGSNITVTDITGSVDTNTVGSYTVTYNFTDSSGGAAAPVTRTVVVVDAGAPVVTITPGAQTIEATGPTGATASYTVSAIDDVDGDISGTATCDVASGSTFALGLTTVTCQATDAASNIGTGSATVTVQDTTAPVITLTGSATMNLTIGDTYTEAGATAADIVDGTDSVTVGGAAVDTATAGTYVVTYDAIDAHLNAAAQVTRTVVVSAPVENTSTLCSDGIDNDGDTLVDLADSDCAAFIPAPVVVTPPTGNGSNGGGGGGVVGNGPFSIGFVNTNSGSTGGQVLGASTDLPSGCSAYLNEYLKKGSKNTEAVKKLQTFLNQNLGTTLPVSGIFGPLTYEAVAKFQAKYADDILKPWFSKGLAKDMNPSGYVYKTTQYKINLLQCATLDIPAPQLP